MLIYKYSKLQKHLYILTHQKFFSFLLTYQYYSIPSCLQWRDFYSCSAAVEAEKPKNTGLFGYLGLIGAFQCIQKTKME